MTDRDKLRYQFLRELALKRGVLEALVALEGLDHERNENDFDKTVDEAMDSAEWSPARPPHWRRLDD